MRLWVYIALCMTVPLSGVSQNNLVPNPSFEANVGCPNAAGKLWLAEPWELMFGSVDYFHACGINGWSTPQNNLGFQVPHEADAYAGLLLWAYSQTNAHEFMGIELTDSLKAGSKYRVEFFVNCSDTAHFAVKSIGVYFSESQPLQDLDTLISKVPQISYSGAEFLANTQDWVLISGEFTASGGEEYLTLGNFDDDSFVDTMYIGPASVNKPSSWAAYVLIDHVSVVEDTSTMVNSIHQEKPDLRIFPNPAVDRLRIHITSHTSNSLKLKVVDNVGRMVFGREMLDPTTELNISSWPTGLYTVELSYENGMVQRKKLVVQR